MGRQLGVAREAIAREGAHSRVYTTDADLHMGGLGAMGEHAASVMV